MRLDDWVLCRVRQRSNNSSQPGHNFEINSGSSSSPFIVTYFNDQESMKENKLLKDTELFQFQASVNMAPQESDEADGQGQLDFQGGSSENSSSDVNSVSQTPMVSCFNEALESLKRSLSIGALDELAMPILPPNKRQHHSSLFKTWAIQALPNFLLIRVHIPDSSPSS
ncbi:hypothetical protein L1049_009892 [Liquidambar formosana]|uniref:Uncharacterized protein n=1 Tax=Liquidambar formosana TaxID=63359 RepID=A0AAP0R6J5_LIQFO